MKLHGLLVAFSLFIVSVHAGEADKKHRMHSVVSLQARLVWDLLTVGLNEDFVVPLANSSAGKLSSVCEERLGALRQECCATQKTINTYSGYYKILRADRSGGYKNKIASDMCYGFVAHARLMQDVRGRGITILTQVHTKLNPAPKPVHLQVPGTVKKPLLRNKNPHTREKRARSF